MKLDGFKLSGKKIRVSNAERVIQYLESLPFRELCTTAELSAATEISTNDASLKRPETLKRRATIPGNNGAVWGSLKTITNLKSRLETA